MWYPWTPRTSTQREIFGDLATSLATQFLVVLGNLLTLKIAATAMSFEDVGQFVLLRRVMVFAAPMLLLGLGVGLPRSLGRMMSDAGARHYRSGLLLSGWALGTLSAITAAALLLLFPGTASNLLLGDPARAHLIKPLAMMILGHQLFMLAYSIRRGQLEIRRANLLQALQVAILPPVVVLWKGQSGVEAVLYTLGFCSILISVAGSVLLLVRVEILNGLKHFARSLSELVRFGFPRVPGDLAAAGLYALPPILVAHQLDLQSAGLLAVGMSLITVLSAAFAPVGMVLLPRLSWSLGSGQEEPVRRRLPLLLHAALCIACATTVMGTLLGNAFIQIILNASFVFERTDLLFLMLAAGGNVIYVLLRSTIDASSFRPLNALHTSVGLGILVLAWAILLQVRAQDPLQAITLASALGFLTLAVLTVIRICRRFHIVVRFGRGGVFHALPHGPAVQLDATRTAESPLPGAMPYGVLAQERCAEATRQTRSRARDIEVENAER